MMIMEKTHIMQKSLLLKVMFMLALSSQSLSFIYSPSPFLRSSTKFLSSPIVYRMQTAPLFLAKDARNENDDNVNVNVIEDIDPLTITAVGFSLIALNFFVFANLGDGGIGGIVARIINLTSN